jgi:hypothetical protein
MAEARRLDLSGFSRYAMSAAMLDARAETIVGKSSN